jgi:hypothetical protein
MTSQYQVINGFVSMMLISMCLKASGELGTPLNCCDRIEKHVTSEEIRKLVYLNATFNYYGEASDYSNISLIGCDVVLNLQNVSATSCSLRNDSSSHALMDLSLSGFEYSLTIVWDKLMTSQRSTSSVVLVGG